MVCNLKSTIKTIIIGIFIFNACSIEVYGIDTMLRVAFEPNLPPYQFEENGKYMGIHIDLLNNIAEKNKFIIEYIPMETNAKCLEALENGKIDMVMGQILQRHSKYQMQFTDSISQSSICMITSKARADTIKNNLRTGNFSAVFEDVTIENFYTFSHYTELEESENLYRKFARKVKQQYPPVNIINSLDILTKLRTVKTEEEVNEIQNAVNLTNEALQFVMKTLKPGIFEYQIKSHYKHQLNMRNSRSRFRSVVAAGKNAVILHYNEANCRVEDGDMVLMDLGAMSDWYVSDITRTYPVNGKFTQRQKELYNIVLEAQCVAMDVMKPQTTEDIVNTAVKKFYAKALKSIHLIRDESEVSKYYYHSIGHPIGLDLHDFRMPGKEIVENSVYTVEPGLYIAEEGLGIRIEENVLVSKDGLVNLSKDIIKTINDIENYMNL